MRGPPPNRSRMPRADRRPALAPALLAALWSTAPAMAAAQAFAPPPPDGADADQGEPTAGEPGARTANGTHASGAFTVGAVGSDGFGAGLVGTFGWDLSERFGIEFAGGIGGMQERSGGAVGGLFAHADVLLPITFNICASVPRVCPALDFELSVLPGVGYAYLDDVHAGNLIVGLSVASLRKAQSFDVGVRATVLAYIDVVGTAIEETSDRLLGLLQLQLGCVVRWGV